MSRLFLRSLPLAHHGRLFRLPRQWSLPQLSPLPPVPSGNIHFLQQTHRLASSSSGADEEILRILKEEIEQETKSKTRPGVESTFGPFTIDDQPGAQEIVLHRSYNNEDIQIFCLFRMQQIEGEGDESDSAQSHLVQMTVKISKGENDPHLEISCYTYGEEPVIDHVTYKKAATEGVKDLTYEGPQFEDLDSNVQKGFLRFLKARGIDGNFGSLITEYMSHKEQREYMRWLENVQGFIAK